VRWRDGGERDWKAEGPTPPLSLLPPSSADGVAAYATKGIWVSALYQALTVLAFEGLGVAADAGLHCLDDEAHWPRSRRALAAALATISLICLVGGTQIAMAIVLLFCPTTGAGGEALLSFCNAPSIFDRL